eukprot:TRINITY_DN2204_c0_g1_i1.p1 TRINITY_DN2204_c0_g1~~TRINITY_DN2204_c0_g1_i1.p1  ORF type:complete len:279 (-),score=31.91 TRINITY_DN2204_c0_g1_i1:342-1178(-)
MFTRCLLPNNRLIGPLLNRSSQFTTSQTTNLSGVLEQLMLPQHANAMGNVHGGSTLSLMDQAGFLLASRYSSSPAISASIDQVDFLAPMYIGNVARCEANITFTSPRSIEVQCIVSAEDIVKKTRVVTNRAFISYVNKDSKTQSVIGVPQLDIQKNPEIAEVYLQGRRRYELRKAEIQKSKKLEAFIGPNFSNITESLYLTLPSDAHTENIVHGGVILKLIDTYAAVAAARFAKNWSVTASLDFTSFLVPIKVGNLLHIRVLSLFLSNFVCHFNFLKY